MAWVPRETVVVPVDFSEGSVRALDEAARVVRSRSGVHAVHVLPPFLPTDPAIVWEVEAEGTAVDRVRDRLTRCLADAGLDDGHVAVRIGDPGSEIASFAEEIGADLIVLPSHGRTGLRRLLIGSVAERVIRLAHCPVLVLRNGGAE